MSENNLTKAREWHLLKRPTALPSSEHFALVEHALPQLEANQLLVDNLFLSVDPYMRGRMRENAVYAEAYELGEAMTGGAVGRVSASQHRDFTAGDIVLSLNGWRDRFIGDAAELQKLPAVAEQHPSLFLGTLGMPGLTAYVGLLQIAQPKAGETVFVSAASGAVGANVCQIAKLKGCRVIGSVGSDEKADWLRNECNIDEVINYKTCGDLTKALQAAAPEGIDVYFENVGGEHLQAAINAMNPYGRIAACGMISGYNDADNQGGINNLMLIVGKKIRMQGFIISDHFDQQEAFLSEMVPWVQSGAIKSQETVFEGVEKTLEAFLSLFNGHHFGKAVVKIS